MTNRSNRIAALRRRCRAALLYAALYGSLIVISFPLFWMLFTSLKTTPDVYRSPLSLLSARAQWSNYIRIFEVAPLSRFLFNSAWYAFATTVGAISASALAAFAFARLPARGSGFLMLLTLGTMLLPGQITMIPQYLLFNALRWTGSYLPLVVPAFAGSAFYILLLRQFYTGVPRELEDAVKMDGGGRWTIYSRVALPLSLPPLITALLLEFIGRWNDFFGPLLYLHEERLYPFALGLTSFASQYGATPWPLVMAASTLGTLPLLLIFFMVQTFMVKDLAAHMLARSERR